MIELTPEQRRVLTEPGPPRVFDPETKQTYILIREELYERLRPELEDRPAAPVPEIPPGIRRSREALRRDLPQLLQNRRLQGRWIAYHGEERIGIARNRDKLLRECFRRGFADDEYYIGMVSPMELVEEEEIVDRYYVDADEDDTAESAS
jgi:AcrR family transcriptional regulator